MKARQMLNARGRAAYLAGMKRYQEQGVVITIDGEEPSDALWEKVFEVREDGGFYMADYVFEEIRPALVEEAEAGFMGEHAFGDRMNGYGTSLVREIPVPYGARRSLKAIRFDLVHHD